MHRALIQQALDLAWSQWRALGVSASGVLAATRAIDLEAIIVFAPILAELDPRLHEEALDWCIQYGRHFASVSCLKQTLKRFDQEHHDRFSAFAAIVNEYGRAKWPTTYGSTKGRFVPSGKSSCHLDQPASVVLRARKIFGINARADLLVGLALQQRTDEVRWTRVNLLVDVGYTKRNISDALNDLASGGMLGTMKFGNVIRYALRPNMTAPLRAILEPLPNTPPHPWAHLLALLSSLLTTQRRTAGKSLTTQAVEATKTLERHRKAMEQSAIALPHLSNGDPWPAIESWLEPLLQP